MNYKVIIREIEYVNRVVYVEAESAEVAAKAVKNYYRVSHDDIVSIEPEE